MLRMLTVAPLAVMLAAPALGQDARPSTSTVSAQLQASSPDPFAYPVTNKESGATTYMMRFKSNAARRTDASERHAADQVLAEADAEKGNVVSFPARRRSSDASQQAAFR